MKNQSITVVIIENNPLAARYLETALTCKTRILTENAIFSGQFRPTAIRFPMVIDSEALKGEPIRYVHALRAQFPQAALLLLGRDRSINDQCHLLSIGIHGFISYSEIQHLAFATSSILSGSLWFSRAVLNAYAKAHQKGADRMFGNILTPKQKSIVALLQAGIFSNKEISASLGTSENTVKFHLAKIYKRIGVHDRHLVLDAISQLASLERVLEKPGNARQSSHSHIT